MRPRLAAGAWRAALLGAVLCGAANMVAADDEQPSEKVPGLEHRVFDVRHRDPDDLLDVLKHLASGVRGTKIAASDRFKTVTVRDFPENMVAIEQALKRLDVPVKIKPDVELRIRILFASANGSHPQQSGREYPSDIEDVIKQLRATLNYGSYAQIASVLQRVRPGSGGGGKGEAMIILAAGDEPSVLKYRYALEDVNLATQPGGKQTLVQIKRFRFSSENKRLGEADVGTALSLREGEKVVVGTANLKDRALVLVLTAKVLR